MTSDPLRLAAAALGGLAVLAALLLALFDWAAALVLLAALVGGWVLLVALAAGGALYRKHRPIVLGAAVLILIALAVVFRPDGTARETAREPMPVSGYGAELWPNRLANTSAFILRERVEVGREPGEDAVDGRGNVDPVATGPLMRELRFTPAAGAGLGPIRLIDGAEATVIVNPIDGGDVHHARGAEVSRVELPLGPVVQVKTGELPRELRIAYLVGAGRSLAPIAGLVTPFRRMPRALAIAIFALLGVLVVQAWSEYLVDPIRRRASSRPKPPAKPGVPGAPGQGPIPDRAPLIPRRK